MCYLCAAAAAAASVASGADARATTPKSFPAGSFFVADFVHPVLLSLGPVDIHSYGLFVALGILVGAAWAERLCDRVQKGKADIVHIVLFFLVGFGGGSKGHMALQDVIAGEPLGWKHLDIRNGHSFLGSMVGSVLCVSGYFRYIRFPLLQALDLFLPGLLLGHGIGKIGCFLSGDGCYGPVADPTKVPWAMSYPNGGDPTYQPVHPTPLYEAAVSFGLVHLIGRFWPMGKAKTGQRTTMMLVLYGISRMLLEEFRRHPGVPIFGGLTEYQAIALCFALLGLAVEFLFSGSGDIDTASTITPESKDSTPCSSSLAKASEAIRWGDRKQAKKKKPKAE